MVPHIDYRLDHEHETHRTVADLQATRRNRDAAAAQGQGGVSEELCRLSIRWVGVDQPLHPSSSYRATYQDNKTICQPKCFFSVVSDQDRR